MDRVDVMDLSRRDNFAHIAASLIRKATQLRFLGYMATSYTDLLGIKGID